MTEKSKEKLIFELQDCNTKINVIHMAGQKLGIITDPRTLAQEIISILEKFLSYEFCAVLLLNDQGNTLIPFAISSQGQGPKFIEEDKAYIESHNIKAGKGVVGWVAKYGETIRSGDVNKDKRYYSLRDNIHSELCVPLTIDNSIIGVVNIETSKLDAYSVTDQLVLEAISSQIAISITNAKMFKEIQEYNIELSNQIIKRTEIEKELIDAKEKAEESNRLKSAFLANMSHEIRTPMNGILGFAGLLKEPNLSGELQQSYIKIIEKSGARMLNIINDIVSISRIESGLVEINLKELYINEQLEYLYNFFKHRVENKKIDFSFKSSMPLKNSIVQTDPEKFMSIFSNLIKNAIKYTEKGLIEFGYNIKGNFYEFYVKDYGIGIPEDRQGAIFERFVQADIEDKMARQGAGLGLSISKAYVEMLGGKIWVKSEEGKGSVFYFTLPYPTETIKENKSKKEISIPAEATPIKKLKIVITEDDEASAQLISIISQSIVKEIINVSNGKEAVEACRNHPDIDMVLMDIQMPEMNGYEATREIRKFNKDIIIIAQTAFAMVGDKEKALASGCNEYLSKPIIRNELFSIIKQYFIDKQ